MDEGFLNLTNHKDHPTQPEYKVFFFYQLDRANKFEERLKEAGIFYEREDPSSGERHVLFAIKRIDFSKVEHLNNLTTAEYKPKFIPNKTGRIILFVVSGLILLLAFIGWLKSQG